MITRVLGFLLIVKALSPFIWLLAAYLVVTAIGDRFDQVSGRYSSDIEIRVAVFEDIAERIDSQIEQIKPAIDREIDNIVAEFTQIQGWVAYTKAQLENLPDIDFSNVVPPLTFPEIRLIPIRINWDIPDVPLVGDAIRALQNAIQGMANTINQAFTSVGDQIARGFSSALAPLKTQLMNNVLAQLQPYLYAYENVKYTFGLVRQFYDGLWAKWDIVLGEFMSASEIWEQIASDLEDQIELSVEMANTMPENLDQAIGDSTVLLLIFAVFTLVLFLIFYWARMMTDLLRGWQMMLDRERRDPNAPPKAPLFDRWAEKLEARERAKTVAG